MFDFSNQLYWPQRSTPRTNKWEATAGYTAGLLAQSLDITEPMISHFLILNCGARASLCPQDSCWKCFVTNKTRLTTKTTNGVLEEYKDLIENTKCDLESHLHDIQTRLEYSSQNSVALGIDTAELQRMEEEKDSTQKSLDICEQFLILIDQSRSSLLGDSGLTSKHFDQTSSSVAPNPWHQIYHGWSTRKD